MHTVNIKLIADQEIKINGEIVNIHYISSIVLDAHGKIVEFTRFTGGIMSQEGMNGRN